MNIERSKETLSSLAQSKKPVRTRRRTNYSLPWRINIMSPFNLNLLVPLHATNLRIALCCRPGLQDSPASCATLSTTSVNRTHASMAANASTISAASPASAPEATPANDVILR